MLGSWWASEILRPHLEESHRDLAITPGEWQAFMDDVQTTLDKFSVPAEEQAEVKAVVEGTRAAIVVSGAEGSSHPR